VGVQTTETKLFLAVLETGRIKMSGRSGSGRDPLPGLQMAIFLAVSSYKRERDLEFLLFRALTW
jgi:hypothetical protein